MSDQIDNFRGAIYRKRARIEEINFICSQPIRKGVNPASRRQLIEERLHLEQAVEELEREVHRLRFEDADRRFRWEDIDQRLVTPRTSELAHEMHLFAGREERRIQFENAKNLNSSAYLAHYLAFHEKHADDWAEKLYAVYCEAWKRQNRPLLPAFIRAVCKRVIGPMFAARKSSICGQVALRAMRTNQPPNPLAIKGWTLRMDRLAARWNNRLEADAVAANYRATSSSPSAHGARATYFGRPENSALAPDTSYDREHFELPDHSDTPSGHTPDAPKSGRKPTRPEEFVACAGKLWAEAKQKGGNSMVSIKQLTEIATRLDDQGQVPPSAYLEGKCAKEVKMFNSKNSHSKAGPIQTWSRLVATGDKDFIRGMRRLLSRCAQIVPQ